MGGIAKICRLYGSIEVKDQDGKTTIWLWDYAKDKPVLKSEMTKEDLAESEKVKWEAIKQYMV